MPNFSTGPATLPDVGELSYNGCIFSPLFETQVSGKIVQDAAGRTTKFLEYSLTADGYVTLPDGATSIIDPMNTLRRLLTQQAGKLSYTGRGLHLEINDANLLGSQDVAWGPIPELVEFQPLGGGRSAKVKWAVKTRISELVARNTALQGGLGPVLQFNCETSVTYGEDGYSTISIRGVLEIPITRPTQGDRVVPTSADAFRELYITRLMDSINLTRFRVTRREFNISRDKRTLDFDVQAEELPPQGLPPDVTVARGNYSVRPARQGMGLVSWLCTLRVTYNVRKDRPRRTAWVAFLALLRKRMGESAKGFIPPPQGGGPLINPNLVPFFPLPFQIGFYLRTIFNNSRPPPPPPGPGNTAWLIDFQVDEGLYLDSRTITFSATWRMVTVFSEILLASGLWKYVATDGGATWAIAMKDISGWKSWSRNGLAANEDLIVDFGGP